jgi:hypothetical protein
MEDEKIQIYFYFDGIKSAFRYSYHVPEIGDEVRFNDIAYKVVYRIWTYDEEVPMVKLNVEPVIKY